MKRASAWIVVAAILGLGVGLLLHFRKDPYGEALGHRAAATRQLAEYLVKSRAGSRALIVSNPFAPKQAGGILAQEEAGIRGLREGFGAAIAVEAVAYPELLPEAHSNPRAIRTLPGTTTPLSFMVTNDSFDKLARQHPACDLIVSLVGLPANLDQVDIWKQNGRPAVALLLPDFRLLGNTHAVKAAMKSGKLAAFISQAPAQGDIGGRRAKSDPAHQFILVTRENLDQVLAAHPRLFELSLESAP